MRKLSHFGVPTTIEREGETYSPDMKLFLTDYEQSPNRIEFLRFDADSEMPELLKTHAHIAYVVEDIVAEMEGKPVVMPITKLSDELTIAFVEEEGIAIELMQYTK
ncbi:MAG: hypothetical protein R3Y19_01210 [Rikenellaceae bacterium]